MVSDGFLILFKKIAKLLEGKCTNFYKKGHYLAGAYSELYVTLRVNVAYYTLLCLSTVDVK